LLPKSVAQRDFFVNITEDTTQTHTDHLTDMPVDSILTE